MVRLSLSVVWLILGLFYFWFAYQWAELGPNYFTVVVLDILAGVLALIASFGFFLSWSFKDEKN